MFRNVVYILVQTIKDSLFLNIFILYTFTPKLKNYSIKIALKELGRYTSWLSIVLGFKILKKIMIQKC